MKKILVCVLLMMALSPVSYGDDIQIVVNDEIMMFENPPYIVNDRTMVPIKFIMDTLGYQVLWLPETRQVKMLRGQHELLLTIDQQKMYFDQREFQSDVAPTIIDNRTYVPLAVVAQMTGASVLWEESTRTVRIQESLDYFNVFYGRGAYDNFKKIEQDLNEIDQLSYAWSRVEVIDGIVNLNTTSTNENTMFYPTGHELVTQIDGRKMLNIYADENYSFIFSQKDVLIQAIRQKIASPDFDEPEFDGVVVDFENLSSDDFDDYVAFINSLKETMPFINIDVALQPRAYPYEKVLPLVDHMILMLHDYEAKKPVLLNINQTYVDQPTAPLSTIEEDLKKVIDTIPPWNRDKILLQLNMAVVQWQGQTSYEVTRYTPGYDLLIDRMLTLNFEDFHFDAVAKQPYVQYVFEGLNNTIWYENEASIAEKVKLVFDYDLGGISLWQLGNLPSEKQQEGEEQFNLRIWHQLLEYSKSID